MSNVVAFKPDRKGRLPSSRPEVAAQILFFTGIRYMRADEDAEDEEIVVDEAAAQADAARVQGGRDRSERLKA